MSSRHETAGPAETEAVGAELARRLVPGDVVLVDGELGAGKTTFVRGACRGLGVTAPVTSPTFTIGQRYPADIPVAHVDLFRITDLAREDVDLLDDYISSELITFVEWPSVGQSQIEALGRIAVRVHIDHAGSERRVIRVQSGSFEPSRG